LGKELRRGLAGCDGVVDGVEDLKARPVLLQAEMHKLHEVACVDIAPHIAPAGRQVLNEAPKPIILVWFDNIADTQRIDVRLEAGREALAVFSLMTLGRP